MEILHLERGKRQKTIQEIVIVTFLFWKLRITISEEVSDLQILQFKVLGTQNLLIFSLWSLQLIGLSYFTILICTVLIINKNIRYFSDQFKKQIQSPKSVVSQISTKHRDVAKILWTWMLTNKQCLLNTNVLCVPVSSFNELSHIINKRSGSFQKTEYSNYMRPLPSPHPSIKLQVHIFLFLCLKYSHEKQLVFTKQVLCLDFFIDVVFHFICSLKTIWENMFTA